jgi:hypothetical protein
MSVLPIVTNVDRQWALDQKPEWARMHNNESDELGELVDDGGWLDGEKQERQRGPSWFDFVVGEIESFEQEFSGQRKAYAEWTALWRKGWWPKRREDWAYKMAPRKKEPFFRKGTQEFAIALRLATEDERRMWVRFGIAQFKPDDPRLKKIEGAKQKREAAE